MGEAPRNPPDWLQNCFLTTFRESVARPSRECREPSRGFPKSPESPSTSWVERFTTKSRIGPNTSGWTNLENREFLSKIRGFKWFYQNPRESVARVSRMSRDWNREQGTGNRYLWNKGTRRQTVLRPQRPRKPRLRGFKNQPWTKCRWKPPSWACRTRRWKSSTLTTNPTAGRWGETP